LKQSSSRSSACSDDGIARAVVTPISDQDYSVHHFGPYPAQCNSARGRATTKPSTLPESLLPLEPTNALKLSIAPIPARGRLSGAPASRASRRDLTGVGGENSAWRAITSESDTDTGFLIHINKEVFVLQSPEAARVTSGTTGTSWTDPFACSRGEFRTEENQPPRWVGV
jgi:hypothetical protein